MKNKKLWIGLAVLAVILLGVFLYLTFGSRPLSPPGKAEITSNGVTVMVAYSRPSVRGRMIFGPADQDALQPYGHYWRLGANEATAIQFNRNILFNGVPVDAGTYRMYAIPGPDSFEVVLNTQVGGSGSSQPDPQHDVLRTLVPTEKTSSPVELFTITLMPEAQGADMVFEWADTRFVVPLRVPQ